jgi:hypothetical protein
VYDVRNDNCDIVVVREIIQSFCHQEVQGFLPERLELGICDRKLVAV